MAKIRNAQFIENEETSGSECSRNLEIKEVRVQILVSSTSFSKVVVPYVVEPHNNQEEHINDPKVNYELVVEQPQ